jgi:hypothetical protein
VAELVDGVTVSRFQVVLAPVKENTVILGLQAVGATTVTRAFKVVCCAGPPGLFQIVVPVCPPTL